MSITSERIREFGFIHALADDAADEIEVMEARIDKLELCLRECDAALNILAKFRDVEKLRVHIAESLVK